MVIWKQNRAHFSHILKNVSQITKKHDTWNLSTMGEWKTLVFPIVQKSAIKKRCTLLQKNYQNFKIQIKHEHSFITFTIVTTCCDARKETEMPESWQPRRQTCHEFFPTSHARESIPHQHSTVWRPKCEVWNTPK